MKKAKKKKEESEETQPIKIHPILIVPIHTIRPSDYNTNEMDPEEYGLLLDNMRRLGFGQPLNVIPASDPNNPDIKYELYGGEHRWHAAIDLGMTEVPIAFAEHITLEEAQIQSVRLNKIHGRQNPIKLGTLIEQLVSKGVMEVEDAAFTLGFADEDEFALVRDHARQMLPTRDMKHEFDKRVKEAKNVDDVYAIVMRLFKNFGDTLPANFMVFALGRKKNLYVKVDGRLVKDFENKARECLENGVTFDSVIVRILKKLNTQAYIDKHKRELIPISEDVMSIDDYLISEPKE